MNPHYTDATVTLTEAERRALRQYMAWGGDDADLYAAVERIAAARAEAAAAKIVAAVDDALRASHHKRSPHGVRDLVRAAFDTPRGEA